MIPVLPPPVYQTSDLKNVSVLMCGFGDGMIFTSAPSLPFKDLLCPFPHDKTTVRVVNLVFCFVARQSFTQMPFPPISFGLVMK